MDDLILRSIDGELDAATERRLTLWRKASPDNERRYRELERLSAALVAAGRRRPAVSLPPSADSVLNAVRERRDGRWRARPGWLAAAAALLTAAGLGYGAGRDRTDLPVPFTAREMTAGPNEATTVHLNDGSVVRLGPSSRLVIGERGPRDVWLEGTAFFAVAKQDGARFTVRSRGGDATVLGTRFEMKTSDDQFRVVVVEGTVEVRNDAGQQVRLDGGQMAFSSAGGQPAVSRVEEPLRLLGWVGKVLLFRDTPLEQVVREIENSYPVHVVIDDRRLHHHLVTGTFADQPVDQLLSTVCQLLGADCVMTPDTVWIRRSGPGNPAGGLADPK